MDPFSYLSVLISIVLALGMTRVLTGVGEMMQARAPRRIYWVHAFWVLNLFLYLVISWWIFYRWRRVELWSYFLFLFVLISPTLLYLASIVLFPPEHTHVEKGWDYREHFYQHRRSFFTLFGLWVVVDVADSMLKGATHFSSLGATYLGSVVVLLGLLTTAAITRSERFHSFLAPYFLLHTVAVTLLFFRTLV